MVFTLIYFDLEWKFVCYTLGVSIQQKLFYFNLGSLNNFFIHNIYVHSSLIDIYSSSIVDSATQFSMRGFQDTCHFYIWGDPKKKLSSTKVDVQLRSTPLISQNPFTTSQFSIPNFKESGLSHQPYRLCPVMHMLWHTSNSQLQNGDLSSSCYHLHELDISSCSTWLEGQGDN